VSTAYFLLPVAVPLFIPTVPTPLPTAFWGPGRGTPTPWGGWGAWLAWSSPPWGTLKEPFNRL